ncbi:MAG: hypothetical protein E6J90_01960 [Deltaproteobacteria bacterium]|nr:MAG: hypothetical protein E6J90_01960 [Deltaproteobacteria bacterium]
MRVMLVLALAACGSTAQVSTGPTWPKAAIRDVDGGESLAPRAAARAIAARVEEDKGAERAPDRPAAAAAATGAASDHPAVTPASGTHPEELSGEEIIIEIDD